MTCLMIMAGCVADHVNRIISMNNYGRKYMQQIDKQAHGGFINIHYSSRVLEWINVQRVFQDLLIFFQFSHLCSIMKNITFAWSYNHSLASMLYKPAAVFKQFIFVHLLHKEDTYACSSFARFGNFYDPLTIIETSNFCKAFMYIRMMDINIVQHKHLLATISQGLNHIPLQSTCIARAVASIMQAFEQLVQILQLHQLQFPIDAARQQLHSTCLAKLKTSSQANKCSFRFSEKNLFEILAVKNETNWLLTHLFCPGLDKASNNAFGISAYKLQKDFLELTSCHIKMEHFGSYQALFWTKSLITYHNYYQKACLLSKPCRTSWLLLSIIRLSTGG